MTEYIMFTKNTETSYFFPREKLIDNRNKK